MQINGLGLRLSTNYHKNQTRLSDSLTRLASGDKFAAPGSQVGADLSYSQRLRFQINTAEASITSLQTGMSFLNTADANIQTVQDMLARMTEIAAASADGNKSVEEMQALDTEFQSIKAEISAMTRDNSYNGKQVIGRDALVSYDANNERVKFFQFNGSESDEIHRDFGSNATDTHGVEIGFDASEEFSMSRDGRFLYFLGTVTGDPAGNVRIKSYDIANHVVQTGSDLFDSGDTLVVDEDGDLYVNGNGTVYTVDNTALTRTATAVVDISASTTFSVYKDTITYHRTDNNIVNYDIAGASTSTLIAAAGFGAGDHSFAGAGHYMAEESPAGTVVVTDTSTGNQATINLGAGTAVSDLHFNEDGDRIFYINQDTNSIDFLHIDKDEAGNVSVTYGGTVEQGINANSFNGLDLGGSSYLSTFSLVTSQGGIAFLDFEAADLRVYALGLSTSNVTSVSNASDAIEDLKEAMNRANAQRAFIRAQATRLDHSINSQRAYISNVQQAENSIRGVDIAKESAIMTGLQVSTQAAAAVLSQFNAISRNVLRLLDS